MSEAARKLAEECIDEFVDCGSMPVQTDRLLAFAFDWLLSRIREDRNPKPTFMRRGASWVDIENINGGRASVAWDVFAAIRDHGHELEGRHEG